MVGVVKGKRKWTGKQLRYMGRSCGNKKVHETIEAAELHIASLLKHHPNDEFVIYKCRWFHRGKFHVAHDTSLICNCRGIRVTRKTKKGTEQCCTCGGKVIQNALF